MYHLIHEHSIGDTSPPIPGQLLVQIFITKEGERALDIQEQQQPGEGRTIFLTVMVLIYKALKLTKGTDLRQYLQLTLTSMMAKDTSQGIYKSR